MTQARLYLEPHPDGRLKVPMRFLEKDGRALTAICEVQITAEKSRDTFIGKLPAYLQEEGRAVLEAYTVDYMRQRAEKASNPSGPRTATQLKDVDPWPEAVVGADVLNELGALVRRHVILEDVHADAIVLWVAHAHAHDLAYVSPILALASPDKRCGKTTTLTLLQTLVPRPLPAANVTAAGVFRAVEKLRPTLMIDEADTFLGENEGLRGVLNSGHVKTMANVVRIVGDDQDVGLFSTWAPKAIAMIGDLPATLADRAIVIRLRRKQGAERTASLRLDRLADYESYGRKVARWVHDAADLIQAADPVVPDGLNDRAADNWRPLLALADTAGGEWPVRARRAAVMMSGGEVDPSPGTTLLRDIHSIFAQHEAGWLATTSLLEVLTKMEDRPWPEWRRGQPLSPSSLSKLLRPYAITPKQSRTGSTVVRGYERADFEEAWARYTPATVAGATGLYRYTPSNPLHANSLAGNEMTESRSGVTGEAGSLADLFDEHEEAA